MTSQEIKRIITPPLSTRGQDARCATRDFPPARSLEVARTLVSHSFASWNRIGEWLRRLEQLRKVV